MEQNDSGLQCCWSSRVASAVPVASPENLIFSVREPPQLLLLLLFLFTVFCAAEESAHPAAERRRLQEE